MKKFLKTGLISTITLITIAGCSSNKDDQAVRPVSLFQQNDTVEAQPVAIQPIEEKSYEATHFSLVYPGDWSIQEAFTDNIGNMVYSSPNFSTTMNLFETDQKDNPIPLRDLFDNAKKELVPVLPEGCTLNEESITIDKTPAYKLSFETTSEQGTIYYERYLCIKDTTAFDISVQTTEKEKPIVHDILASMKLHTMLN